MSRVPKIRAGVMPETYSALRKQFPGWEFGADPEHQIWHATKRSGTSLRYVVAHRPLDLAMKLSRIESATEAEEARSVTRNTAPDYRSGR